MSLIREALNRVERQRAGMRGPGAPPPEKDAVRIPEHGGQARRGWRGSWQRWAGGGGFLLLVCVLLWAVGGRNQRQGEALSIRPPEPAVSPRQEGTVMKAPSQGEGGPVPKRTEVPVEKARKRTVSSTGSGRSVAVRQAVAADPAPQGETGAAVAPVSGRDERVDREGIRIRVHREGEGVSRGVAQPQTRRTSDAEGSGKPDLRQFHTVLEQIRAQKGPDAAADALAEGLTRYAGQPGIYRLAANMALRERQFEAAGQWAREGLKLLPDDPDCLTYLGLAALHQQDLDLAEQSFRKALEGNPGALENLYYLGLVHDRRGKWERALASYLRFVREYPPEKAFAHRDWVRKRIRKMEENCAGGASTGSDGQRSGG